jgi:hypothetical protein
MTEWLMQLTSYLKIAGGVGSNPSALQEAVLSLSKEVYINCSVPVGCRKDSSVFLASNTIKLKYMLYRLIIYLILYLKGYITKRQMTI